MPSLQGLIFDLDGTLVDSAPDVRQALNTVLRTHGRRPLTLEEIKALSGDGLLVQLQRAFAVTGDAEPNPMNAFQEFITAYRALMPDPAQIYPDVRETLERYHKLGVKLGVCTNKQEAATLRLLDQLDLSRYFEFIAGGDTFPTHKPNPDHVYGVLSALDVEPETCVMIGDSPNDIAASHGAKIPCIAVTHGYALDAHKLGADAVIEGFSGLEKALKTLGFTAP